VALPSSDRAWSWAFSSARRAARVSVIPAERWSGLRWSWGKETVLAHRGFPVIDRLPAGRIPLPGCLATYRSWRDDWPGSSGDQLITRVPPVRG
jgi:hypothetical protein